MPAPLTNDQKRYLSQLAERAWRFEGAKARGRGEAWEMNTKAMDNWRRAQVAVAVQKAGLRCCSQADYSAVKAHFHHLLGEDGKAMHAHVRSQSEEQRQAEWKVAQAVKALGRSIFYADGICRRMFHGTALQDASPGQLWKLLAALNYQLKRERQRSPGKVA